jgi:hypothetical protein
MVRTLTDINRVCAEIKGMSYGNASCFSALKLASARLFLKKKLDNSMINSFIIVCTGNKPNIMLLCGKKINCTLVRKGMFGRKKDKLGVKTKIGSTCQNMHTQYYNVINVNINMSSLAK